MELLFYINLWRHFLYNKTKSVYLKKLLILGAYRKMDRFDGSRCHVIFGAQGENMDSHQTNIIPLNNICLRVCTYNEVLNPQPYYNNIKVD